MTSRRRFIRWVPTPRSLWSATSAWAGAYRCCAVNSGSDNLTLLSGVGTGRGGFPDVFERRDGPHLGPRGALPRKRARQPGCRQQRRWQHRALPGWRQRASHDFGPVLSRRSQSFCTGLGQLQQQRDGVLRHQRRRNLGRSPRLPVRRIQLGVCGCRQWSRCTARLAERIVAGSAWVLCSRLRSKLRTTESEAVEVGTAAVASGPSAGGQSMLGRMGLPDEFEEMGASVAVIGGGMPSQLPWARYVTGVDQAIENAAQ